LSRLRTKPSYFNIKQKIRRFFSRFRRGDSINDFISRVKAGLKRFLFPTSFFEDMGINYYGPVDGHDIGEIRHMLRAAKHSGKPCIVHCITKKGKGYKYSEENPERFHGSSGFNIDSGEYKVSSASPSYSDAFGSQLVRMAREDRRICAVTAGMTLGVGLKQFASLFPKRFFDVGIAEDHGVTMSAGLAKQGMKPVCAIYSTFLQRAYDQLIHDVAIEGLHVVFCLDRAGIVPGDGKTHQGLFDVPFLRTVPGMKIMCPGSEKELVSSMRLALDDTGPVAIRYEKCSEGEYKSDCSAEDATVIRQGSDAAIVCYGAITNEVLAACRELSDLEIECEVIKLFRLDVGDYDAVYDSVKKTGVFVCVEESVNEGSMGMRIAAGLALEGIDVKKTMLINAGAEFLPCGSINDLRRHLRMDRESIVLRIRELIGK
ncbi:MAG: 1-deoxy-D-xylulose-5-phosphate synthase, partial [Clostridiales bacterium]|nr:1-deoxy-D-xylulose-5-phosphate synthase [Clostridiales bacterium]